MKNCPVCQSDSFKKISLIHEEGVSASFGAGVGVGMSGLGVGVGVGGGKTTTALAAKCSPPIKNKKAFEHQVGYFLFLVFLVPLAVAFTANDSWGEIGWFWKAWAGFGVCFMVWMNIKFDEKQDKAHKQAVEEYDKTYMCTRCGHFFQPFD